MKLLTNGYLEILGKYREALLAYLELGRKVGASKFVNV